MGNKNPTLRMWGITEHQGELERILPDGLKRALLRGDRESTTKRGWRDHYQDGLERALLRGARGEHC